MINSFISDLSIYSHSTILFITTFIFRYLIIFRSENNFDVYGHLYFIKMVKENGKGPFESIQTNIIKFEKVRLSIYLALDFGIYTRQNNRQI